MSYTGSGSRIRSSSIRVLLLASTALAFAGTAFAQEAATTEEPPEEGRDVVVVVGSQIVGAQPTETLPVSVIGQKELDAIGATSGDELFRSIPQLGDVGFGSASVANSVGGVNSARGDTASINLRALGTGNTLVLLNGRRMVNHPGTQAENLVPVVTVNANSIPTMGVRRIEVLLDGASAIYGADAVAGVVNTVLKDDLEGFTAEFNYGAEEGAGAEEFSAAFELGLGSDDGRTHLSLLGSFLTRDPVFAADRDFTANADQRSRLPADWAADTNASAGFNNTSITSAWGIFDKYVPGGTISVNGTTISNAAGQFHLRPTSVGGCAAPLSSTTCFATTSTRSQGTRYNTNEATTVTNGVDRHNLFAFFNHEFDGGLEFFAEGGVYLANSLGYREAAPMLGAAPIVIPAGNYYNPFGPVGSANRVAITNAPAGGLDLVLGSLTGTAAYRPIDAGPRRTEVENFSSRALAGLRGDMWGWDWESALLYTSASTEDKENRVSNTRFQEALSLATPEAYNPFSGGCPGDVTVAECTRSSQVAIDHITVQAVRESRTSLASWDFKISRPDLFTIWAGDVGAAIGVEARRETYVDDRDPRQDGTIMFTDRISGLTTNDLMGNNLSLDTKGSRSVQSGYVELQVPLVSPDMNVPFAQSIDMQLATRYENFDTFGSVTKPKVALSWRPFDFLMFRSAWSEGFRAPNLQQIFETDLQRSNNRTDYIFCEAASRVDPTVTFATSCAKPTGSPVNARSSRLVTEAAQAVVSNRKGSENLQPEESTNLSYGLVFESSFLPEEYGKVTFTADWWRIEQDQAVGIVGDDNAILLDYVLRLQGVPGGNPLVVRSAPDAQQIADFAGTGLQPVGAISYVRDDYLNMDDRIAQGWDFGLYYDLFDTPVGDFSFRVNAALLDKFFQSPTPEGRVILEAGQAGILRPTLRPSGQTDLIRDFGRPEWRYTSSLTWSKDAWSSGWFTSYVGDVYDDFNLLAGQPWIIEDYQTHNLYVQYEFDHDTDKPLRLRVGARNITDETPPLADTNFGFLGELHSPQGRFVYVNVRKTF